MRCRSRDGFSANSKLIGKWFLQQMEQNSNYVKVKTVWHERIIFTDLDRNESKLIIWRFFNTAWHIMTSIIHENINSKRLVCRSIESHHCKWHYKTYLLYILDFYYLKHLNGKSRLHALQTKNNKIIFYTLLDDPRVWYIIFFSGSIVLSLYKNLQIILKFHYTVSYWSSPFTQRPPTVCKCYKSVKSQLIQLKGFMIA